jgi:bifunctional non-homologous end joining protein LigD
MRVNRSEEFVIGGYMVGGRHFDALVLGYLEGDRLMYAARTRSGFTPAVREQLHQRFRGLETPECPFANLPEARAGRWGEGSQRIRVRTCRWQKPVIVAEFEFVEWTPDRHSRFVGLRAEKKHSESRHSGNS